MKGNDLLSRFSSCNGCHLMWMIPVLSGFLLRRDVIVDFFDFFPKERRRASVQTRAHDIVLAYSFPVSRYSLAYYHIPPHMLAIVLTHPHYHYSFLESYSDEMRAWRTLYGSLFFYIKSHGRWEVLLDVMLEGAGGERSVREVV